MNSLNTKDSNGQLAQGFKPRHVTMLSIAGIIGAGLFVGSGLNDAAAAYSSIHEEYGDHERGGIDFDFDGEGEGAPRTLSSVPNGGGGLGGGHDKNLGLGQELRDGDGDIARARWQIEQQDVEVTKVHVPKELLQGSVQ